MATKRYNQKVFTFTVNGQTVSFYCDKTITRTGFCHHAFVFGLGRVNEHTRVKYYNRTWESFTYESVLYSAVAKLPKKFQAPLRLELEAISKSEHEKADFFVNAFKKNFDALSNEQKAFIKEHTPEITNMDQAKIVNSTVAVLAAVG